MNFYVAMGLIYIGVITVSVFSGTIILMLARQKVISLMDNRNSSLIGVSIFLLILSLLYFLIDYYSLIINFYGCGPLVRIIDIWASISLQYFWYRFLRYNIFTNAEKYSALWKTIFIGYIIILIESAINYGGLLNDSYFVGSGSERVVSLTLQIGQSVFLSSMNIVLLVLMIKNLARSQKTFFAVISTVMILANGVQNTIDGTGLITGRLILQKNQTVMMNATALLLFIFGMCILWYTIKFCFLAQYQREVVSEGEKTGPYAEEERLKIIAKDSQLTERETEIMQLIYFGATYQNAAEALYISKNTIKHHITSMYGKIGVSSKMELINLVREMQTREEEVD